MVEEKYFTTRWEKLFRLMARHETDALLINTDTNIRYLTGFSGEEAQLLVTNDALVLLSDSRFIAQLKVEVPKNVQIVMKHGSVIDELKQTLQKFGIKRLAIEGESIDASFYVDFTQAIALIKVELWHQTIEGIRLTKDENEISLIHQAIKISEDSFNAILKKITVGTSEKQIAADLEYEMKSRGAESPSFPTIVASGVRSAWPHGEASDKLLANHELVTIDFGCYYHGYTSDITRTIALGTVAEQLKEIYQVVEIANERGITQTIAGNVGQDVDDAARGYITQKGYGKYFGHGIGHGIGLDIHEIDSPYQPFRPQPLINNMVTTVEPGIYLEGLGGVRIEDDVLIRDEHPQVLTTLPKKELIIL